MLAIDPMLIWFYQKGIFYVMNVLKSIMQKTKSILIETLTNEISIIFSLRNRFDHY